MCVLNHTRPDFPQERADIITLVEYIKKIYFTKAVYWICEVCGWDYYFSGKFEKEKVEDPCLKILEEIEPHNQENEVPLTKLNENVLNEFIQYPHQIFYDEGIDLATQYLFEIGYSIGDNCITIPIRDELGNLVGVKGRTTLDYEKLNISKYWYLYPVPKTQILFGLDKTYDYIKRKGFVIVFESEKSVMKAFGWGIKNCVSIGGHELSATQILKLEKLGVKVVLALDKDVSASQVKQEASKFLIQNQIYTIFTLKNKNILDAKDAPVDKGKEVFQKLLKEDCYKALK